MKFIVAGVGPGDPDLITISALNAIKNADLVLCPRSRTNREGVAEEVVLHHFPDLKIWPVFFPMTKDAERRDAELFRQIEALRPQWENAQTAVLPVIGDSSLYATGFYLHKIWRKIVPDLALELRAGISAHSFAAAATSSFLAMGSEIFTVIPGGAEISRITNALSSADCAAIYKPSSLGEDLRHAVESTGPWKKILRVDRAGLPDQKIFEGKNALENYEEYLSILLLWR